MGKICLALVLKRNHAKKVSSKGFSDGRKVFTNWFIKTL